MVGGPVRGIIRHRLSRWEPILQVIFLLGLACFLFPSGFSTPLFWLLFFMSFCALFILGKQQGFFPGECNIWSTFAVTASGSHIEMTF
jgi:hypothetical protein